MFEKTNVDEIIDALNRDIYSIKETDLTQNGEHEWNIAKYCVKKQELADYVNSRLTGDETFEIQASVVCNHIGHNSGKHGDGELLSFLFPKPERQSCKLKFRIRRRGMNAIHPRKEWS